MTGSEPSTPLWQADIDDSRRFVVPLLPKRTPGRTLRALDVGAGIGRITGALLLDVCDTVDLLEGASNFVTKAKEQLAWAGERVERYICEGMQNFTPEVGRYELPALAELLHELLRRPLHRDPLHHGTTAPQRLTWPHCVARAAGTI